MDGHINKKKSVVQLESVTVPNSSVQYCIKMLVDIADHVLEAVKSSINYF